MQLTLGSDSVVILRLETVQDIAWAVSFIAKGDDECLLGACLCFDGRDYLAEEVKTMVENGEDVEIFSAFEDAKYQKQMRLSCLSLVVKKS